MTGSGGGEPGWFPAGSAEADIARVATLFTQQHGRAPDGVWAAPGRVNLIGEHVDYNAGYCMPFALAHRAYAAVAARQDGRISLTSAHRPGQAWQGTLAQVGSGAPRGWAAYGAGVAWALAQDGWPVGGFDAVIHSRVPLGAGLSSSAALECAVAVALSELFARAAEEPATEEQADARRARLAQACVRAENEVAGAPTGGMDQSAALRARAGHAMLLDCQDFSVEQVPLRLQAAGAQLLVIDTRVHHALGDGQYGSRRQECALACARLGVSSLRELADQAQSAQSPLDEVRRVLGGSGPGAVLARRVGHVLTELGRVQAMAGILRAGGAGAGAGPDLAAMGLLLDASHRSMRDDYEISCAEVDLAVSSARSAGALGARMVGGGFGGSIIALVLAGECDRVAATVVSAFAGAGLRAPSFAVAAPGAAAERVR